MEVAMLPLLLAIVAPLLPTGYAVECYVCSWSPDDVNRTNLCGKDSFSAREAYRLECELGCETYIHWDKNDVLEQYRRNCIQGNTPITGNCVTEENKASKWERCTCTEDLCNSAISWNTVQLPFLFLKLGALLLWSCMPQLVVI